VSKGSIENEAIVVVDVDEESNKNDEVNVLFFCIRTKPRALNIWEPLTR
jgi:hypothetical protein